MATLGRPQKVVYRVDMDHSAPVTNYVEYRLIPRPISDEDESRDKNKQLDAVLIWF